MVTGLLFTNSPPALPSTDIAAVWSGTVSLLLLALKTLNNRLRVLDNRLYLLAREVSELRGSTLRRGRQ